MCLTSLPGVAPGDRASLMSDRRSQSGIGTTPMTPNFCAGAYPWGKTAKALPTRVEGWPSVLRAFKTPIFAKGQKLTHSPAHEEKHAGQETPLHYFTTHPTYSGTILVGEHFCNLLKPPLRTTTPTRTLYWVWLKIKSWVLKTLLRRRQENTALLSNCGLTGDATTHFPC